MCKECAARRELARKALQESKMGTAARHLVVGVAEAVGLKEKTGEAELKAKQKPKSTKPGSAG